VDDEGEVVVFFNPLEGGRSNSGCLSLRDAEYGEQRRTTTTYLIRERGIWSFELSPFGVS
jgi:hypothetical protein